MENEKSTVASDEISAVDAHLARMTGFLLAEHRYYYWAIGWGFHALKSYQSLHGEKTFIYEEFIDFIIRGIILRSLRNLENDASLQNDSGLHEIDLKRIKIRAIKDFIDFKYMLSEISGENESSVSIKESLKNELSEIENGMKKIFCGLAENSEEKKTFEKDVLSISQYRDDCKKLSVIKDFFEKTFF